MDRPAYPSSMKGMYTPQARVAARQEEKQTSRHKKTGSLIIVGCIAIALAAVLAISYFVAGSMPAKAASAASQGQKMSVVSCDSMQEAADLLGYIPAIPAEQADGYTLVAVSVVDGNVLEMDYSNGKQSVLYRTAVGSEDLSWDDTEYAFTTTEEVGGLNRTYAGAAEQKLSEAIWANEGNTFALVAPGGVDAEVLHVMAENVG